MAAVVKAQPWLNDEQRTLLASTASGAATVVVPESGGYVEGIERARGLIVLVAGGAGLAAFELKTFLSTHKALARVPTSAGTRQGGAFVITRGDYSYVVGGGGLCVVDISGLDARGEAYDEPDASMALVSDASHQVRLSQPWTKDAGFGPSSTPEVVCTGVETIHEHRRHVSETHVRITIKVPSMAAQIRGDVLFVVGGCGRLATFDISDPAKLPRKLGGCVTTVTTGGRLAPGVNAAATEGGAHCLVHASEPLLYVACGRGLAIVDVSDPSNPKPREWRAPVRLSQPWSKDVRFGPMETTTVLSTDVSTWDGNPGMAIVGDDLYVSGGKGVACFDISDPRNPVKRFRVAVGGSCVAYGEGTIYAIGGLCLAAIDARASPPRVVAKTSPGGADVKYYVDPEDGAGKLVIAGGGGLRVLAADHTAWAPGDQLPLCDGPFYDGDSAPGEVTEVPGECCTIL